MLHLDNIPTRGLADFITGLASQHRVKFRRTHLSDLARTFTRLSDDDVEQDDVQRLVVALRQARVIDGPTMVELLGNYLDEKFGIARQRAVRPVQ